MHCNRSLLPSRCALWPMMVLLAACGGAGGARTAHAEVGYAMRGSPQPFHHWDSAFNNSSSREHYDDGVVLKADPWGIRPHFGIWAGHIDNVYLDPQNGVEDVYLTLAPGLMFVVGSEEDNYLTLNYIYETTTYTDCRDLDFDSHLLSAGLHLQSGHFQVHLSDQYSDTTDTNPEAAQRTSKIQNIEELHVRRDVSRKTALEVEQRYEIHNYQADGLLDYDEYALGGRGHHQTFAKVSTFVDGLAGRINMKEPAVIGDARYVEFGAGFEGRLTAKSSLYARGSWHSREFEDRIEPIDTWGTALGLSSRFSRRSDWGIDVARRLTPSSQLEGVTRESTAVMPSVRHILWRDRLSFSVRGAYEWADYYGPEGEWDREDTYWYVSAVLDWHPAQIFTVGVGYTHSEQDSNNDDAAYEQNHLFVRGMLNY